MTQGKVGWRSGFFHELEHNSGLLGGGKSVSNRQFATTNKKDEKQQQDLPPFRKDEPHFGVSGIKMSESGAGTKSS